MDKQCTFIGAWAAALLEDARVALDESKRLAERFERQATEDRMYRAGLDERLNALVRQSRDQQRSLRYLLAATGAVALLLVAAAVRRIGFRANRE